MKKLSWILLLLPLLLVSFMLKAWGSQERWSVSGDSESWHLDFDNSIEIGSNPCQPNIKSACEDQAEALNEAHERRMERSNPGVYAPNAPGTYNPCQDGGCDDNGK